MVYFVFGDDDSLFMPQLLFFIVMFLVADFLFGIVGVLLWYTVLLLIGCFYTMLLVSNRVERVAFMHIIPYMLILYVRNMLFLFKTRKRCTRKDG